MTREARCYVAMLVGAITVRLVISGSFGSFVHERMRYPLLIAGAALVLIGLYDLFQIDDEAHESDEAEDHVHGGSDRVGWLLAVPVLVLIGVSPTALGADAVGQFAAYEPTATRSFLPDLSAGTNEMTLIEYQIYAVDTTELRGRTVQLTGFVVNDGALPGDSFRLTRFVIGCCAADAFRLEVVVTGAPGTWENDTWVTVTGTWNEPPGGANPNDIELSTQLTAIEIVEISEPDSPYESI